MRACFRDAERTMMPGPLPDLKAIYRTTGISTITDWDRACPCRIFL